MRRISRNFRHDDDMTETNVTILSLGEAVKRWTSDGQFLMTEVNSTDAYESNDSNIPLGSVSQRLSRIEAVLAGIEFTKDVKAASVEVLKQSDSQSPKQEVSAE